MNDFLWIFFALGAVFLLMMGLLRTNAKFRYLSQPRISLLLLYPLLYLGLLSFASTKLPHYAIPAYPFFALLTGYAMERLIQSPLQVTIKRLLNASNSLLMFLGTALTVAGFLVVTTDIIPGTNDIRPYAPIAIGLGLGWLGASLLWFQTPKQKLSWLALLLLGHWISLTLAWGTADLGNVNPEMKALLIRDDIQPILHRESVNFSPGLNSKRSTLLRFYTPNPGDTLQTLEQSRASDYLWIEDSELPTLPQSYDSLGQIKQTHLVRIRSE